MHWWIHWRRMQTKLSISVIWKRLSKTMWMCRICLQFYNRMWHFQTYVYLINKTNKPQIVTFLKWQRKTYCEGNSLVKIIFILDNVLKLDESHESMVKQITGNPLMAIIVSVSVVFSVLMSAIISLVIWRLKRPDRTIMRASSPVQEQQTSNKATTLGAANTYCFNEDARLSHFYSSPIEISTSLNNQEWHFNVFQRECVPCKNSDANVCDRHLLYIQ